MKLRRVGTGMTERYVIRLEALADPVAAQEFSAFSTLAWKTGGRTAFGMTAVDQAAVCTTILERHNGPFNEDSEPYFARWYLHLHRLAQKHIAEGNADLAALTAWEAGSVFARAEMKFRWERFALTSERTSIRFAEGAKETNKTRSRTARAQWVKWRNEADRVAADRPGVSKHREAELVIERLDLSEKPDTVARAIKKVRTAP